MFPKYWAGPPSLALADSQEEENRPQDQVLALVLQIWEQGKDRIVTRIDTLEQATLALLDGRLETELRREAEREAHKLAGSLTTFGFPQGSRLARDIEQTFQADSPLESKDALRLTEKVVSLRQALEREPVQPASQPSNPPPSTGSRLLVIDDDREVGDRLTADAPGRGLETEFTSSLTAAREAISRHRPAVVLLNLSAPKAKAEHLVFIEELSGGNPPIPVLVRTRRDATLDRVQVAQAGGRGFLPDSLPPSPATRCRMWDIGPDGRPTRQGVGGGRRPANIGFAEGFPGSGRRSIYRGQPSPGVLECFGGKRSGPGGLGRRYAGS